MVHLAKRNAWSLRMLRLGAASVALSAAFLLSGCIAALPYVAGVVGSGAAIKAVGNSDAKGNSPGDRTQCRSNKH